MLTLEVKQRRHTFNHDQSRKEFRQWFLAANDPSLSIAKAKVKSDLCSLLVPISKKSLLKSCAPHGELYVPTALALVQLNPQASKLCRRIS
jgi:hypothetical protein